MNIEILHKSFICISTVKIKIMDVVAETSKRKKRAASGVKASIQIGGTTVTTTPSKYIQ